MNSTSILIAASMLKDMDFNDSLNSALFTAAFSELDELRLHLEKIPLDIEEKTNNFNSVTVNAVDDFVHVANDCLSKFMQRTKEINDILVQVEKTAESLNPLAAAMELQAKTIQTTAGTNKTEIVKDSFLTLPFVILLCGSSSAISFLLAYIFFISVA